MIPSKSGEKKKPFYVWCSYWWSTEFRSVGRQLGTQEWRKSSFYSHSERFAGLVFWEKAVSCLGPWKMRFAILNSTSFVPLQENKAKTSEKRGLANLNFEEHSLVDKLKRWSATMHSHKTRACASNLFFFFLVTHEKKKILHLMADLRESR